MKITDKDFTEAEKLLIIFAKINQNNPQYFINIADDIFQKQPFLLSTMLGYQYDLGPEEFDYVFKLHLLIWEYFKTNKQVLDKVLTLEQYIKVENLNIKMFKYAEGEPDIVSQSNVFSMQLDKIKSKALLSLILLKFNTEPVLLKMQNSKRASIMIGVKSLLESFESL